MHKKSKIYVAGHTGLAGSAIVRTLRDRGYTNLLLREHKDLDLVSQQATFEFFNRERPDFVFLCAGRTGGIMAAVTEPAQFLYENSSIQNNVVEASHRSGIKKLLFMGSSCVYPRDCPQPIKEEYLMTGPLEKTNDAFAVGKIEGIFTCQAYNSQYGTNFVCIMPCNIYGPNDSYKEFSHVLPSLMRKFHTAKVNGDDVVTLWGTGTPRREFIHADDLADACLFIMDRYDGSEILNVGTGLDLSIKDLARKIKSVVRYEGDLRWDTTKPNGTPRKLLDTNRIHALGWQHKIKLDDGIMSTYQWYKKHPV